MLADESNIHPVDMSSDRFRVAQVLGFSIAFGLSIVFLAVFFTLHMNGGKATVSLTAYNERWLEFVVVVMIANPLLTLAYATFFDRISS